MSLAQVLTMWFRKGKIASSILAISLLTSATDAAICRPFDWTYPAPTNVTGGLVASAGQQLEATFDALLANETVAAQINTTSFSVEVFSLNDPDSSFTYHYTSEALSDEGTTTVNPDSIYRTGSIAKLWTVYIWLMAAGDSAFNDPITKYVPELEEYAASHDAVSDPVNIVDWSSITVGALASQVAGISRDPTAGYQGDSQYQALLGLPAPAHEAPNSSFCGDAASSLHFYCNRSDFFTNNLFRAPNVAPFDTPVYSNLPYQILSYALENITNTSFPELFQTYLVEKHNLTNTYFTIPPADQLKNSVIPINTTASLYNVDFRESSPFGGYFSSLNDVTKIARAILNSTFLTPAQTHRWMKPSSFAPPGPLLTNGGIDQAVGAPWEILRGPAPPSSSLGASSNNSSTAASQYQTWIYTKSGDIGLYSTLTLLVPEFQMGVSILAAGPVAHSQVSAIADLATELYIPAFFETSRQQTATTYGGTFSDSATNSSATLTVPSATSADQGLILSKLTIGGADLIAGLSALYKLPKGTNLDIRLYPNGLSASAEQGWKASFQAPSTGAAAKGAFSSGCWAWATIGGLNYGGVPFDDIRFEVTDGRVAGMRLPALGVNMTRAV